MYNIEVETNHTERLYPQGKLLSYGKIITPECWVFARADVNSPRQSQYTFGECLKVLAKEGEFSLVQSLRDQYSGWILSHNIETRADQPESGDYRTIAITTVHHDPDMKSPILATLPVDACVNPIDEKEHYCLLDGLGWVNQKHLCHVEKTFNPVDIARAQIGRSYVWGGRGIAGLDCSALSQLCYRFAGRNIPRDSDLQQHFLKAEHRRIELCELERGDLIFLPAHVMIAADAYTVIHANAHHMRVVIEDLKAALSRSEQTAKEDYFVRCYRWRGK